MKYILIFLIAFATPTLAQDTQSLPQKNPLNGLTLSLDFKYDLPEVQIEEEDKDESPWWCYVTIEDPTGGVFTDSRPDAQKEKRIDACVD